jgi:hypothetical protein
VSSSIIPRYALTNDLLSAFEVADNRKTNWLNSNTVNSVQYFYPYKYKLGYDGLPEPQENFVVFRLAELYLMRAEARARQNNIAGALADLNKIRNRAGLAELLTTDQNVLLTAIAHERQVELFCEWGSRWLDLKRLGLAGPVLSVVKSPAWQNTDVLYPIPQTEISKNQSLTQNPGY